jgi:hypothetical protein
MMRIAYRWLGVAVLAAAVGFGCAAGSSVVQARDAFSQARDAGSETKAAYDYYAAETYLQLAELEYDDNDLRQAEVYAQKSLSFSERALKTAGGGAR